MEWEDLRSNGDLLCGGFPIRMKEQILLYKGEKHVIYIGIKVLEGIITVDYLF